MPVDRPVMQRNGLHQTLEYNHGHDHGQDNSGLIDLLPKRTTCALWANYGICANNTYIIDGIYAYNYIISQLRPYMLGSTETRPNFEVKLALALLVL